MRDLCTIFSINLFLPPLNTHVIQPDDLRHELDTVNWSPNPNKISKLTKGSDGIYVLTTTDTPTLQRPPTEVKTTTSTVATTTTTSSSTSVVTTEDVIFVEGESEEKEDDPMEDLTASQRQYVRAVAKDDEDRFNQRMEELRIACAHMERRIAVYQQTAEQTRQSLQHLQVEEARMSGELLNVTTQVFKLRKEILEKADLLNRMSAHAGNLDHQIKRGEAELDRLHGLIEFEERALKMIKATRRAALAEHIRLQIQQDTQDKIKNQMAKKRDDKQKKMEAARKREEAFMEKARYEMESGDSSGSSSLQDPMAYLYSWWLTLKGMVGEDEETAKKERRARLLKLADEDDKKQKLKIEEAKKRELARRRRKMKRLRATSALKVLMTWFAKRSLWKPSVARAASQIVPLSIFRMKRHPKRQKRDTDSMDKATARDRYDKYKKKKKTTSPRVTPPWFSDWLKAQAKKDKNEDKVCMQSLTYFTNVLASF